MNRKNKRMINAERRRKYHKKYKKNNKIKNLHENIAGKAKEYINYENIQKIKDTAGKGFEKAKNFTSENIDKFQKYLYEQNFKSKIQNISNTGMNKIKEHSKKKYISRLLIFLHKHYMLNFSILFIISILLFRNIYITHNREIEKSLNYSIINYMSSLDNIIIAKEDYYTNIIITEISNKTYSNNIVLKSSSIDNLETALKNVLDSYNIKLQTSLNETIKSSNNIINFWFAFLTVIIIVFILIGIIINNRIIKISKNRINKFNKLYKKKLNIMKKQIFEFENLKKESENNLHINNLYNLANISFDSKDYDTSIYYYDKVLELNNSFIHAVYNRAIAYYYVNNYTKCAFELIALYNNNKSNNIKNLILKNIIALADNDIETAVEFCSNKNIDYKSLQQKEAKHSLFERIRNILS